MKRKSINIHRQAFRRYLWNVSITGEPLYKSAISLGYYKRMSRYIFLLSLMISSLFCGSIDETDTGITSRIYNPDCTPAVSARVSVFKTDDTTQKPIEVTTTDKSGSYRLSRGLGYCSIWAEKSGLVAARVSVDLSQPDLQLPIDTLRPPISISGVLALEPNQAPLSFTIQVLGSDRSSTVDSNGRYKLTGLVPATFTIRIVSTMTGFAPVYQYITVLPEKNDSLYDTIHLATNRIPAITGLTASYEKAAGIVSLRWNAASFPGLQNYVLYRGPYDSALSNKPISYCRDTVYHDTLFQGHLFPGSDTYSYRLKYRVAARDSSGKEGLPCGPVGVWATNPRTNTPLVFAGSDQVVDIGTTVHLQGSVVTSVWPLARMEWKIGLGDWVNSGNGTASFTTSSTIDPDTTLCIFKATDSAGNTGFDTLVVEKRQKSQEVITDTVMPFRTIDRTTQGVSGNLAYISGKFWAVGKNRVGQMSVWSTSDLTSWGPEIPAPEIQNNGQLIEFKGNMYLLHSWQNCYRSSDGVAWEKIAPNLSAIAMPIESNFCVFGGKLYWMYQRDPIREGDSNDVLCTSEDGMTWNHTQLSIHEVPTSLAGYDNKLYLVTFNEFAESVLVSEDKGLTWRKNGLWNPDTIPESNYISQVIANDSVLVVAYRGVGNIWEIFKLREGKWDSIPLTWVIPQVAPSLTLYGNRLLCAASDTLMNYRMHSIKLY